MTLSERMHRDAIGQSSMVLTLHAVAVEVLEAENAALKEENQRYRRLINRHRLGILKVDDDKGIKVT